MEVENPSVVVLAAGVRGGPIYNYVRSSGHTSRGWIHAQWAKLDMSKLCIFILRALIVSEM